VQRSEPDYRRNHRHARTALRNEFENTMLATVSWGRLIMSKQAHASKSTTTQAVNPKKKLKELFDERDRTRPGSKEEKEAAEKIMESLFPDTNAG